MLYLDTSLLVSAMSAEPDSRRVQLWLYEHADQLIAISGWVETEFSSAMGLKVRRGTMAEDVAQIATAEFRNNVVASARHLPIALEDFRRAAAISGRAALKVRGSDALHLAVAEAHGAILCTLDKSQAAAGQAIGIDTVIV